MPRASSGALVDSVNVATVWFSFCRAEALRDTAGERLAAVQTQRDHAFPAIVTLRSPLNRPAGLPPSVVPIPMPAWISVCRPDRLLSLGRAIAVLEGSPAGGGGRACGARKYDSGCRVGS
jgi:hypothetical protein